MMPETQLTPANQNPWYVLMTLYGEQEGGLPVDENERRAKKNRAAWNAWACQGMSEEERAKWDQVQEPDWKGWEFEAERVMADHKAAMMARNGAEFVYPGFPDPSQAIVMKKVVFGSTFYARGLLFPGFVDFSQATFSGIAGFDDATFSGETWFGGATFSRRAWFSGATFCWRALFGGATFSEQARFDGATFSELAWFGGATFSELAWFDGATFSGGGWFDDATFSGGGWFADATFSGEARFGGATFSGFTYFSASEFGTPGGDKAVLFTDCQFERPTTFRAAIFHATYPRFSGAILHDQTTFDDHPDHWPKGPQPDPAQAKASCAVIRHNLGRQGLPEAEHFFFRREMGFAGQVGGWWQRLPYRAFGALSDYGYSIARPSFWLLALFLVFGTVMHAILQWQAAWDVHPYPYNPFQAFALSASNLVSFLGFQRAYLPADFLEWIPPLVRLLSAVETVAGVVLLFLLALGFRTRFRMR